MRSRVQVRDYMVEDVEVVSPSDTAETVASRIRETGHDGFPVCNGETLVGYIEARNILCFKDNETVEDRMTQNFSVIKSEMKLKTAGRIMFREGRSELPIINDNNQLVGLITNTDILRAKIERTTPRKATRLQQFMENLHEQTVDINRDVVPLDKLHPTQPVVFEDELEGRQYELDNGLAEPVVVIKADDTFVLADGHHRVKAAQSLQIDELEAYILSFESPVELGMLKQAKSQGLKSISDIKIDTSESHPLIENTQLFDDRTRP